MNLICIQSRSNDFTVGELYKDRLVNGFTRKRRIIDGDKQKGWILNGGGLSIIAGDWDNPLATFEEVKRKPKSLLKMLVRAFVLVARSRGWGDSKNGANKSWSGTPYKNTKDWARCIAGSYDIKEVEQSMFEDDPNLKFIDQEAVNLYAENEIDNW